MAGTGHPNGCLIMTVALPIRDRLPKVAAILETMPKEDFARLTGYFNEQINLGKLPENFDAAAATALLQDLSTAMITQARAGVPLCSLQEQSTRNARLVLFEGQS